MGLINNPAATPAFEAEDGATATPAATTATTTAAAPAAAPAATPAAAPAASTAVAPKPQTTALAAPINLHVLDSLKDHMRVEYNTLVQLIATNGNIVAREDKTVLGDTVVFELLSWQDSFVVSPGDDAAPDDVVKYSDDGITTSDGLSVADVLAEMKLAWPKARLAERVVVVGAVESAAKTAAFNGTLVQFDLSPSSRTQWKRYMANAAYGLHIANYTAEQVRRVKCETKLQSKGTDTYTLATFAVAG